MTKKQIMDAIVHQYFDTLDMWWYFENDKDTDETTKALADMYYARAQGIESVLHELLPNEDFYYRWAARDI